MPWKVLDAYNAQLKRMMNGADLSSVNLECPCRILFIFIFNQVLLQNKPILIVCRYSIYIYLTTNNANKISLQMIMIKHKLICSLMYLCYTSTRTMNFCKYKDMNF